MRIATALLAAAGLAIASFASVSSSSAADLDAYVGKYPFDKVRGRTLYQIPELKRDFIAKFGQRRWNTLLSYGTAAPIERIDDPTLGPLIVAQQCKPHDCPTAAVVFLTPDASVVGVCFTGDNGTEWAGEGWSHRQREGNCGEDGPDYVARFKAAHGR